MILYSSEVNYQRQKEIFSEQVLSAGDSVLVITNEAQKRLSEYWMKFSDDSGISLVTYDEYRYNPDDSRDKLLFRNWYTRYLSGKEWQELPVFARDTASNSLIFSDTLLDIYIYRYSELDFPPAGKQILKSVNDFEGIYTYWRQDSRLITDEKSCNGGLSWRVPEFSATFEMPLDSILIDNADELIISASACCYFAETGSSKLVISVEDSTCALFWNALDAETDLPEYNVWWPVIFRQKIESGLIKKGAMMKVYLWNIEGKPVYIDCFLVEISVR
ncbi:MAG: hypothetical protein Kow00127_03060 [Bacteroidales bacterium]